MPRQDKVFVCFQKAEDDAASWTYGTGETKRTKHTMVVYADKPEYALTHLLEKGHQKRGGGRTKAIVHIAPAEEEAVDPDQHCGACIIYDPVSTGTDGHVHIL